MGRKTLAAITAWAGLAAVAATTQAQDDDGSAGPAGADIADRCGEVLSMAPEMARDPRFASMPDEQKLGILGLWGTCAIEFRDMRSAYEAFGMLAPIAPEPVPAYLLHLRIAVQLRETRDALGAFDAVEERDPQALAELELTTIGSLITQASALPLGDEIALGIHEVLARIGYEPTEPLSSDEGLRVSHARLLLQLGRLDDAARSLGPPGELGLSSLIVLSAERLFDPILAELEPIDFVAEARLRVDRARESIDEYPRLLKARYLYMLALRDAGQDPSALEEADRVLAEIAASPDAFDDTDEYLNWIHNDRAYALYALGEHREGRDAMQIAASEDEHGSRNVSQVINRGMLLADEGRWDEAQDALRQMGQPSTYGDMFSATVRVCAAAETGNDTLVAVELAFLRSNAAENYAALQQALVCADELDEAAGLYVRRLEDPTSRARALMALQRWAPDPARLPFRDKMYERLEEVQNRPEVHEALAAVGRSREIPLPLAYWSTQY